jgi:predicted GH43/DUF377 family glycosyl hydrolase
LNSGLRRTYPLGVFRDHDAIALIGREKYSDTYHLVLGHGQGRNFHLQGESPSIVLPLGRKEHLQHLSDVRISQILDQQIMTYTVTHDGQPQLRVALHNDQEEMNVWDVPALGQHLDGSGMVVAEYLHNSQYVLYYGERDIRVAFSKNLIAWHAGGQTLLSPRRDMFDRHHLKLVSVAGIDQGLLVLYETRETRRGQTTISAGYGLFSKNDPEHLIWRCDAPLYEATFREKDEPRVLGAAVYEHEIAFYLSTNAEKLILAEVANPYPPRSKAHHRASHLHRFPANPILSPTTYEWESHAVLNPAAFVDNDRVHLLYRAMGPDGVSRLGYASSADGVHFDQRLDYPIYTPEKGFGQPTKNAVHGRKTYDLIANPSGGGWAGCEDPRAVTIDGQVYLSYVAFDGWNFVRQALTSLPLEDFRDQHWGWRKPVLISKPGEIQKNWVIFPEKINGKYAILHGLSPNIHIDYVDSLDDFDGKKYLKSLPQAGGSGYAGRPDHWDSRVRGAGAPPLKTPMGWLLLYHATDKRDPGKYKLGAMLLDLQDPTKVLFRCSDPVLEPQEWYENDGKPGVVYTCGAVIVNDNLIVYYGGGDKHIAVARANVDEFLGALTTHHAASLLPVAGVI